MAVHPLDRVGVHIGGGHLHRGGQIEDHLAVGGGLPHLGHRIADLDGEFQLRAGVGLGGVLEVDLGLVGDLLGVLLAQLRTMHGDVLDALLVEAEDDASLQGRRGVVEVHDRLLGAADRLEGALDEVLARLGQHLDDDAIGDHVLLDEHAHEVEVRLGGGREADLDLLEAHRDEELEHLLLARGRHRIDEGLVAVAEVDGAPAGRLGDDGRGPGAVGQVDGAVGAIALPRHGAGLLGIDVDGHVGLLGSEGGGPAQQNSPRRGGRRGPLLGAPRPRRGDQGGAAALTLGQGYQPGCPQGIPRPVIPRGASTPAVRRRGCLASARSAVPFPLEAPMRKPLIALTAVALGAALVVPAPALAAKARPDLPEVRTTVALEVNGSWSGRIAFGLHSPGGQSRALRPLPLELDLSRSACDLTGCMTTRLVLNPTASVPGMARISGSLTSAALMRSAIAVTVQRIVDGTVVNERPATLTLEVVARKAGPLVKRTTLTQGPDGEVLSIARTAPMRATVMLADDTLTATGEVSRVQIVD